MPDLLDGLNPQQQAAVTLPPVSALILAGAGSGKTRVLTTRIAWLLQTGQASAHNILAVTFTNKAAREMQTRLTAMLPMSPRDLWIGTFHGLSNRLLRTHHAAAGLPRLFQILDQADQLAGIKRMLKAMQVDTDRFDPRKVQQYINQNKENGLRADRAETGDPWNRRMAELHAAWDEQCQREGVVDFAELLLRSNELLERHPEIREHYRTRFHHVLIDEFQDTNRLQYRWLKQFAGEHSALMAVGDDDQSIYAFRGAHSGNMLDFQREFAREHLIRLEQNYRSQGNILDAANALIGNNPGRLGKTLWTAAGQGEPIRVLEALDDQQEARFVCERALALQGEGQALSDIAVLYRSNAQSRVLEHALFSAGIPYRVHGGLRFFERQEIRHALAYLRLLAHADDDSAFLRVVNFPTRGIGARTLEQLDATARAHGCSLWQACTYTDAKPGGRGLGGFVTLIDTLREHTRGLALPEIIEHTLHASGLIEHYRSEKEGQDRLDNLDELVQSARVFLQDEHYVPSDDVLSDFLALASLEAGNHAADAGQDALQLMTVHAAKGLEFGTVFLTGLEEGLFPGEQSLNERHGIEEERRLMYVAITRARKLLYLSLARVRMLHGQTRYGIPSRFLDEIPPGLMRPAVTAAEPVATAHAVARPTDAATARSATPAWPPGMSVRHPKFGIGVILRAEGGADDARVQVRFGREHGEKWLALAYARLEPITAGQ